MNRYSLSHSKWKCQYHIIFYQKHLCVSMPPKESVSDFVGYLKGRCAIQIFDKHPEYRNKWNQEFWARGYYVTTVGDITEEAVRKYIEEQEKEDKEADRIR